MNENHITIRELVPAEVDADRDTMLEAVPRLWNDPDNNRFISPPLLAMDDATLSSLLKTHKDQDIHYLVAMDDSNEILGLSVYRASRMEGFYFYDLVVRPDAKRRGIGRQLIESTIEAAHEGGYKAIEVLVFADNFVMLRLVLSYEFVIVGMDYHKRADGMDAVKLKKYL